MFSFLLGEQLNVDRSPTKKIKIFNGPKTSATESQLTKGLLNENHYQFILMYFVEKQKKMKYLEYICEQFLSEFPFTSI